MMNLLPWMIPLAPLFACIACACLSLGGRGRNHAHWLAWAGLLVAAVVSVRMLYASEGADAISVIPGYTWMDIGAIQIPISLRFDAIALVQICVVTCVSFLVVVYSKGYMHGDPGYARFFAVFSGFVFSMSMLVLAGNLLVLYAFWEGVGLCSYLLIGYWYQKPSAAKAATKAFLVNRIADCGFLIGILTLWYAVGLVPNATESAFGRLDFESIFAAVPTLAVSNPELLTFIGFMMLMGAVGKSAQFPLHVWLPDAMEGPTPVSALIHAATMVTAGVYLMARMSPLLQETPDVLIVAGHLGAITALLAALIALFQDDLKRVLAYSTVSQLGYLFMALGTGAIKELMVAAVVAAMFHLITHAFFKALLFLSAGNVMHAMGDVIDMRRFGGLRKVLPMTNILFLIGALALAGLPPLAGFFSKDGILALLAQQTSDVKYGEEFLLWLIVGLITALITSLYTFRAYFRTFWGEAKYPAAAGDHPHEATPEMLGPMGALALGSVVAGLALAPTGALQKLLGSLKYLNEPSHGEHESLWLLVGSSMLALAGLLLAWMTTRPGFSASRFGSLGTKVASLGANRFYIDELYSFLIVAPIVSFARLIAGWDLWGMDGIWQLITDLPAGIGRVARRWQSGAVSHYAVGFALGVVALLMLVALRG